MIINLSKHHNKTPLIRSFCIMLLICFGIIVSPHPSVYAANESTFSSTQTSTTNPYLMITNKIVELEHNSSHTFQLKIVGLSDTKIIWNTSNPSIATVSSTGEIKAISSGYVTIIAKDQTSGKKSYCKLYVRPQATEDRYFTYKISNQKAIITGYNPSTLTSQVVIPSQINGYPVTQIDDYAFYNETSIDSIDFPASINQIGEYSFYKCTSLKKVTLPHNLKVLGKGAFASCTSLTSCDFPANMTKISDYAFNNCTSLTQVKLPTSCKSLGANVFSASGSNYLTNLQIAAIMGTDTFLTDTEKQVYSKMKSVVKKIISKEDSPAKKVKLIHDWLVINSTYDLTVTNSQSTPDSSYSAVGIILYKTGVCSGYAEAFNIFMTLLGIDSKYVVGTGDGVNHAWNLVKLDNKWYQVDVTWDDPVPDNGEISYNYFLVTDSQMAKDHKWKTNNYPVANSTKYRYFAYQEDLCDTAAQVRKRIERGLTKNEEWITILAPSTIDVTKIVLEYTKAYSYRTPTKLGSYVVYSISIK
jgi:hypothetical protein